MSRDDIARIHSTRVTRFPATTPMFGTQQLVRVPDGGEVCLSHADYATLYSAALRGAGQVRGAVAASALSREQVVDILDAISASEEHNDLPHVDGLGIVEFGIFSLEDVAAGQSEFRVWLNNGQRLSFAVPATRRLFWFNKMARAFFQEALGRAE